MRVLYYSAFVALAASSVWAEPTVSVGRSPASQNASSSSSDPGRELIAFEGCAMAHNIVMTGDNYRDFRANSSKKCCHDCRNDPRCEGYTWTNDNGGTCSFMADPDIRTKKIRIGADTCLTFWNRLATRFIFHDCDMPGNDLSSSQRSSPYDCESDCVTMQGCLGVTWTNYNGGTCWFKADIRECVPKAGAESMVVLNKWASYADGINLP